MIADAPTRHAVMPPAPSARHRGALGGMLAALRDAGSPPPADVEALIAPDRALRVYVAAPFARLRDAERAARLLRKVGHAVVSTWHSNPPPASDERDPARRPVICRVNVDDLARAEALLMLADEDARGALVELGIAWGRGLPVVAVGDRARLTLMAELPAVRWFRTAHGAVNGLAVGAEGA